MDSLCLVMPAYNEEENIASVIRDWYPRIDDKGEKSIFIINISGSTDGTEKRIESLKSLYPKMKIIKHSENNYGAKVLDLYDAAVQSKAEFVFQTDSDGQTNPEEFDEFWRIREDFDAVIGNRTNRKDGFLRMVVEKIVVFLVAVFFKVKIPDANAPFRLMRAELLSKYLKIVPRQYSMPNILFTTLFAAAKEKIFFKEISFGKRCAGTNKMNYKKIIKTGFESIKTFNDLGKIYGRK